jgi:hypothetical protein
LARPGPAWWRSERGATRRNLKSDELTKVGQEKTLCFEPLIPNATTIKAMKEARAGHLARFDSIDALMADLHEDD